MPNIQCMIYCLLLIFFEFSLHSLADVASWYDKYSQHSQQIDELYVLSLKLSKLAKENHYKDIKIFENIKENLKLAGKFCSDSYESQIYFQALQENRAKTNYEYQFSQINKYLYNLRQGIYQKCKKLRVLLSQSSMRFNSAHTKNLANNDLQSHQTLFENIKYVYKEVKNIKDKLSDKNLKSDEKYSLSKYYQNYKNFDCDWEYEKKLYINSKVLLKAQMVSENNEKPKRDLSQVNYQPEINTVLEQLERSHLAFEKFCEEIQHEKDRIKKLTSQ